MAQPLCAAMELGRSGGGYTCKAGFLCAATELGGAGSSSERGFPTTTGGGMHRQTGTDKDRHRQTDKDGIISEQDKPRSYTQIRSQHLVIVCTGRHAMTPLAQLMTVRSTFDDTIQTCHSARLAMDP